MIKKQYRSLYNAALAVFFIFAFFPQASWASPSKVLVVMSYHETYPWVQEIIEGLTPVLGESCEVRYFYMDTKKHFENGPAKAKQAYELYQEFQPDGVITVDDNAQSMFVVPYLKNKVKTPVIFCGVNSDAEKYGYPASNVSGVLERYHVRESITLAQEMIPSIKTIGYMMKHSPTASAAFKQIQDETNTYPAKSVAFKTPKTLDEAVKMAEELKKTCDLLFIGSVDGISDKNGKILKYQDVIKKLTQVLDKPCITNTLYRLKCGPLCTVIESGQEQGKLAGQMLLKAMQGTPVSQIPITRNTKGKAAINVTALKLLGIKPDPTVLHGAMLVKTEK